MKDMAAVIEKANQLHDRLAGNIKSRESRVGRSLMILKHLKKIMNIYEEEYYQSLIKYFDFIDHYTQDVGVIFDSNNFEAFRKICSVLDNLEMELNEFEQLYPLIPQ